MDALFHGIQAVLQTARYRGGAIVQPFLQNGFQVFLRGAVVQPHHHQINGNIAFHAGLRHQRVDKRFRLHSAGFWLKHKANGVFAIAFVAHFFQQVQHQLFGVELVLVKLFFACFGLGIGLLFNFCQDFGGGSVGRQFAYHHAPLSTRQLFHVITRAHADAAFACFVNLRDVFGGGNNVCAASKIGRGNVLQQIGGGESGIFQQCHRRLRHFAQIVRWNFGCHAHGDAACAVEQHHRQPRGQRFGLFKRAVIIGDKVHRALVDFAQQQLGKRG